jgi:predicted RNA-binding protein with TRAM domain
MATMPSHSLRHLSITRPWLRTIRSSLTTMASLAEDSTQAQTQQPSKPNNAYFPKRGQILELVCESLGFKGKGVCKVEDSGFIVMCDRALPGERFIGRVTRKKGNYAEVLLLLFGTLQNHKITYWLW